jgi:hypothetical protein
MTFSLTTFSIKDTQHWTLSKMTLSKMSHFLIVTLNVVMLSVIMLSVLMRNDGMLNVVVPVGYLDRRDITKGKEGKQPEPLCTPTRK